MNFKRILLIAIAGIAFLVSSCRPPSLEQAIIDYNGGRYDNAFVSAKKATEKFPDNAEAWYYLGELYGRKNQVKEMLNAYEKSLKLDDKFKSNIERSKKSYFTRFYNDAINNYNAYVKLEDKKSEKAVKSLKTVISDFDKVFLIKKDYQAVRLVSLSYQYLGDEANALKYMEKAAEVEPDTVLAWMDLGYYYFQKKDYAKASEYFKRGIEVDPNHVECLTMYAQSLDFGDKKDEAIKAYKVAIERNPEEKAIPFNLGLLLYKQGRLQDLPEAQKKAYLSDAAIYLEKAHVLDPEIKEIYDLLGALYIETSQYDKAETLLKEGLEHFPDSANIWSNLSVLYAKQNKKKEATEAYKRAEALQKN